MLIYAHTGLSDERSAGNENADKLAVAGAEKWGQIAGIVAVRAPAAGAPFPAGHAAHNSWLVSSNW